MEESILAKVKIKLYGKPLELELTMPKEAVKPTRMLPVFHQITNDFVDTAVDVFASDEKSVSCKAGCGACCRQAVPLAEFEVFQIAKMVDEMPEPKRSEVKKKFADACGKLDDIKWFERLAEVFDSDSEKKMEAVTYLGYEYFQQGIPCPFLENESCSIHPVRPLSCREFLVTSPSENCRDPLANDVDPVEMKFKVSELLRSLWKTDNLGNAQFVTMIEALRWAEKYPDEFVEKPGNEWLDDFFRLLRNG